MIVTIPNGIATPMISSMAPVIGMVAPKMMLKSYRILERMWRTFSTSPGFTRFGIFFWAASEQLHVPWKMCWLKMGLVQHFGEYIKHFMATVAG